MSEIVCPNCGERFQPGGAEFCPNSRCGYPVSFMEPEVEEPPEEDGAVLRVPEETTDRIAAQPPRRPTPPPEETPTVLLPPVRGPIPASQPVDGGGRGAPPRGLLIGLGLAFVVIAVLGVAVAINGSWPAPAPAAPSGRDAPPAQEGTVAQDDTAGEDDRPDPEPTPDGFPHRIVDVTGLNVRAEPSLDADVLLVLTPDDEILATERTARGSGVLWREVRLDSGAQGWASDRFLAPTGDPG